MKLREMKYQFLLHKAIMKDDLVTYSFINGKFKSFDRRL